jgi:hypothetical protein
MSVSCFPCGGKYDVRRIKINYMHSIPRCHNLWLGMRPNFTACQTVRIVPPGLDLSVACATTKCADSRRLQFHVVP